MSQINPRLLVKSLTETRARILMAFLFSGRAMDVNELATWTGKPRNAHYTELAALCGDGLIAKGSRKMAHGRDVYLLGSDVLPLLRDLSGLLSAGKYLDDSAVLLEGGQMSALETPEAATVIVPNPVDRSPDDLAALNAAFDAYRIIGKKRDELLACEWVNADYVHAHVAYANTEERWGGRYVGMAITRMLGKVSQPGCRDNGHIENCKCAKCQVDDVLGSNSKYISGPYADFIEH